MSFASKEINNIVHQKREGNETQATQQHTEWIEVFNSGCVYPEVVVPCTIKIAPSAFIYSNIVRWTHTTQPDVGTFDLLAIY
jgi:hypothetical protein